MDVGRDVRPRFAKLSSQASSGAGEKCKCGVGDWGVTRLVGSWLAFVPGLILMLDTSVTDSYTLKSPVC